MSGEREVRLSLNRILASAGMTSSPVAAFSECPILEQVALRFINFVSPWLVLNGDNLAERTLSDAIRAYDANRSKGASASYRSFIERIAQSAGALCRFRVSVQDGDGLWAVWSYDEPLMRHLANYKQSAIQIRERESPVAEGLVMIKLLSAIGTTRALEVAGLDFNSLLAGSAAA